ncbi:PTS fructose transporter subunit IIABC [Terrilactibacillus laevilacticus]|uniref:Fructose-specific PTS transporter subunit EIIC n=1 Tax=Terrilactibacillus laevilacticus TaxID=1380157 RepID=A0ABW5PM32_9BACI|nr:PTS fructose transporter subunit IIABC [Terrilactibacillus laevilacticus]
MKVTELLTVETVNLNLKSTKKEDVLDEMAKVLYDAGKLNDLKDYRAAIAKRESESTTGIGEGIAIPHAKTAAVKVPSIAFGRSVEGLDYASLDGKPAHLFFMIAATEGANQTHLQTLSKLSTYLIQPDFREQLFKAETPEDIIRVFEEKEEAEEAEKKAAEEAAKEPKKEVPVDPDAVRVLAVTACPTGIAHTYIAADSLKAKAKDMGYEIKVQTNGSTGIQNHLTPEDIKNAKGIIVAADTKVDLEPFIGKPVLQVPVTAGIRNPEGLIKQIVEGEAPIYNGDGAKSETKESSGSKQNPFYKHLMNGVSHMLPFVVGGGILIAISFLFGINSSNPNSPQYNPFAAALHLIGADNAIFLMVPVLAGFIAFSIAERPGLMPGMVGGMMAVHSGAGFLGGLIAGFLAGYVVVLIKKVFANLPQALAGLKPVLIFPVLGVLITGLIMYVVNSPIRWIMNALTDWLQSLGTGNLVLLGMILGAMTVIDMGGPINKAAFTFGIAMIDAHFYYAQAAIMAGGMVAPLGMGIATSFFKNKFTKQQRDTGLTAYVLGATFVTEGAIPFAAADPLRVIVSSVIGAAVAGGLALFFKIGLQAPHGGIFVAFFVNGNPVLYILSIIIGALITGLVYGVWKKPIEQA